MQFATKIDHVINMQVLFDNRNIATIQSLKFLGQTDRQFHDLEVPYW